MKRIICIGTVLSLILLIMGCNNLNEGEKMNSKIVVFETNMGNFEVELNSEKAPISVENFLSYVNEGFYDGLIFSPH